MGSRGYVGVLNPDATVTVRYVHSDATLDYLPYAIAAIWWRTFAQDTANTIAVLTEFDWDDLDPTTLADSTMWSGSVPVVGVGMALHPKLTEQPITEMPTKAAEEGGLLFLLDPARPGVLVIADGSSDDLSHAPTFDLRVGEHVRIPQR